MPEHTRRSGNAGRDGHEELSRPAEVQLDDESSAVPTHAPPLRPRLAQYMRERMDHLVGQVVRILQPAAGDALPIAHVAAAGAGSAATVDMRCPRPPRADVARRGAGDRVRATVDMARRPVLCACERAGRIRDLGEVPTAVPAGIAVAGRAVMIA